MVLARILGFLDVFFDGILLSLVDGFLPGFAEDFFVSILLSIIEGSFFEGFVQGF